MTGPLRRSREGEECWVHYSLGTGISTLTTFGFNTYLVSDLGFM